MGKMVRGRQVGTSRDKPASKGSTDIQLKSNFVFEGDYINQGYFSLETLMLLLCLKAK